MRRTALTLLELLVVVAIIAVLVALLLPAVQFAREAARRAHCSSNLKQIIIGVHQYEGVHRIIPPGGSNGFSFHVAISPYLEQDSVFQELHGHIDPNVTPMNGNSVANSTVVPLFLCPSDYASIWRGFDWAGTNYAGNAGTGLLHSRRRNGVFQRLKQNRTGDGPLTFAAISDGTANTVAVAEYLIWDMSDHPLRTTFNTRVSYPERDPQSFARLCEACLTGDYARQPNGSPASVGSLHGRPWTFGDMSATLYTHSLAPNRPSCYNGGRVQSGVFTSASLHPNVVGVAYADGHVTVTNQEIDLETWRALGGRDDGVLTLE